MHLRKLEMKDAPLMLSWMHDESVVRDLYTDFSSKSLLDCEQFISLAQDMTENVHFAIASDEDEYMGTVSLKHIDREKHSAEFAITMRKESMGRGYSWYGMETVIEKAFSEFGLEEVYWCVSRNNQRAIRFYDKHHYLETTDLSDEILTRYEGIKDLKWYSVHRKDVKNDRISVVGCRIKNIATIPTLDAGNLSFFEESHDIEFDIKRVYYISKVPEGVRRGFHAHKKLKQFLFCPYGRIQLILENELGREEIELNDPSIGVVIDRPTWREILWLQKDSVLCVAASEYYNADDYIRDYNEFKAYIGE